MSKTSKQNFITATSRKKSVVKTVVIIIFNQKLFILIWTWLHLSLFKWKEFRKLQKINETWFSTEEIRRIKYNEVVELYGGNKLWWIIQKKKKNFCWCSKVWLILWKERTLFVQAKYFGTLCNFDLLIYLFFCRNIAVFRIVFPTCTTTEVCCWITHTHFALFYLKKHHFFFLLNISMNSTNYQKVF